MIIEFLQEVAGSDRLLPARGPARFKALTLARLADGIMDASILVVYDGRFRPGEPPSERWLAHQRGKINRGLAAFETAPPDPGKTDIVSIGLVLRARLSRLAQAGRLARRPIRGLVDWLARFQPRTSRPSSARARPRS